MSGIPPSTPERRLRFHHYVLSALVMGMVATSTFASSGDGRSIDPECRFELDGAAIACPPVLQHDPVPVALSVQSITFVAVLDEGEVDPDSDQNNDHPALSRRQTARRQPLRCSPDRSLPSATRRPAGSRSVRGPPLG